MGCESNSKHKWAVDHGLQLCGQYYEGFVDDYEGVLNSHMIETVTSYGVRRSRQAASTLHKFIFDDKENFEDNLNLDTSSSTKEVCWIDQSTKNYSLYMKNFVNEKKKRLCNSQSTCMSL